MNVTLQHYPACFRISKRIDMQAPLICLVEYFAAERNSLAIVAELVAKFIATWEYENFLYLDTVYTCSYLGNSGVVVAPPWRSNDANNVGLSCVLASCG